jgi:puromycin-sensitive aminopeptidase
MAWWNGLWLNEAFATFMQLLAVDAWKPAWQRWDAFSGARARAFEVDGLRATRPLEFNVVTPADAEAMFDPLTDAEGAAVLRLLEQHLGFGAFREGVRRYLSDHRFGNAETADLWRALGTASAAPVPAIMDRWVGRPGYPVVTVRAEEGGRTLSFTQRRFSYLPEPPGPPELWQVPLLVRARVNGQVSRMRLLLTSRETQLTLPGAPDWVVVNEGGHGFYRVRYATELLEKLTARPADLLAPVERFNLISDAWASALAGLSPASEFLDLTARFRDEDDRNVWAALVAAFTALGRVTDPAHRAGLEALVRDRLGRAVARLGWTAPPGESDTTRQLRGDLLRAMGTLGNDGATQLRARELYRRSRGDPSAVDPNVLAAVIPIVAARGDEADYGEFLARLRTATTPPEEQRYLYALAGFRPPDLLARTLGLVLSGEIRIQDAPLLLRSLLTSVDARELAWRFVKEHWQTLTRRFPASLLVRMWEGVTALATPALEADVRAFVAGQGVTLGGKILEQYLEQLRIAVAFREREAAGLAAYLSPFSPRR